MLVGVSIAVRMLVRLLIWMVFVASGVCQANIDSSCSDSTLFGVVNFVFDWQFCFDSVEYGRVCASRQQCTEEHIPAGTHPAVDSECYHIRTVGVWRY
jgi:hypothetical protein